MSTPDLASYERNEKFCPERKPTKAELDAMARDEQENDAENKEAKKNSYISQIIAFWIGVWTWLPRMIYNFWLKIYDSLLNIDVAIDNKFKNNINNDTLKAYVIYPILVDQNTDELNSDIKPNAIKSVYKSNL